MGAVAVAGGTGELAVADDAGHGARLIPAAVPLLPQSGRHVDVTA